MKIPKISNVFSRWDNVIARCFGLHSFDSNPVEPSLKIPNLSSEVSGLESEYWPRDTAGVVDVSGSMSRDDLLPSRLDASVVAMKGYAQERAKISPGDRIAFVSFSGFPTIILPLTGICRQQIINESLHRLRAAGSTDLAAGLKGAEEVLFNPLGRETGPNRLRHILFLTDGQGGDPLRLAESLKERDVLIEVIGCGGKRSTVNERLLRKMATTDRYTHYWFINDADKLVAHYRQLATGLVARK